MSDQSDEEIQNDSRRRRRLGGGYNAPDVIAKLA